MHKKKYLFICEMILSAIFNVNLDFRLKKRMVFMEKILPLTVKICYIFLVKITGASFS